MAAQSSCILGLGCSDTYISYYDLSHARLAC